VASLNEIKRSMQAAVAAGDPAAARAAMREYITTQKNLEQSMVNIDEQNQRIRAGTPGGSVLKRTLEGAGSGFANVGRRATNLVLPDSATPRFASDASIEEAEKLDAPLLETGGGTAGRILAEVAATAPITGGAGALAGRAATALPAAVRTARGAAGVGRLLGAMGEGALGGALTTGDAAEGAAWGAGLNTLGGLVKKVAKGAKRTPAAQRLLDQGADLTPGQMNPKGVLNQAEQAMGSVPGLSQLVTPAREAAERSIMPALVRDATGLPPVAGEQLDDLMRRAVQSFDARYDQFKGFPVTRALDVSGINRAMRDPNILAAPTERRGVARFVAEQIHRLPDARGGRATVGDLMAVRSSIRKAAADATRAGNLDRAALLDAAEEAMSGSINTAMPTNFRNMLRAVDDDYSRYKTWSKAVHSARDRPRGPTLPEARGALAREMSDSAYNRGTRRAADRQFLQDASESFETVSAPTGARILTLGGLMGAGAGVGGPIGAAAVPAAVALLAGPGRRFAQGNTSLQRAMRAAGADPQMRRIIELLRASRGGVAGAMTSDEEGEE
jgi:hypothetical protein